MAADLGELVRSPFDRLRALLHGTRPGLEPIDMSIGAPRHPMPKFLPDIIHDHAAACAGRLRRAVG